MTTPRRTGAPSGRVDGLLESPCIKGGRPLPRDPLLSPGHLNGGLLFAYWESRLDEAARGEVEEHVAGCPRCCRRFVQIGQLICPCRRAGGQEAGKEFHRGEE